MSSAVATTVLAYLPSPDRGVWYLGPIPIRAYALCIIAGIIVAVLWGERRFIARGGEPGAVIDIAVFAVPFGLIGGRLYHVATDWQTYFGPGGSPIDALKIWQGGLGIWGAVALGGVGAWIGCRRRGIPLPIFADAVAPGIVVAQAIGRLGNWFNQELYGAPTTAPWGLEIYRRVDPATGAPDPLGGVALDHTPIAIVHPTFLYELIWNLLVAALVLWADRRFRLGHGRAFALYVAGYTAGRFVIEQMRTDPATRVLGDLRINVVVSAVVFVAAVFFVLLAKKGREALDLAAGTGSDTPDRERERIGAGVGAGVASAGAAAAAAGTLDKPDGPTSTGTGSDDDGPPAPAEPAGPAAAAEPTAPAEPADVAAPDVAAEPPTVAEDAVPEAAPVEAAPVEETPVEEPPVEETAQVPVAPAEPSDATAPAPDTEAPPTDGTAEPAATEVASTVEPTAAATTDSAAPETAADATADVDGAPAATEPAPDPAPDSAPVPAPDARASGAGDAEGRTP